ncbi:hypothetical protein D5F01_LYC21708 [Larimichthys crocea]|uniref:Uncharacterized protein n=1 Tax=Larimichthys crocea TaxID=215358 RepID=A0A6G0HK68_LARCR|nr:hypothetical protein D5F01_LYC21708 [Larimichthys crocea]
MSNSTAAHIDASRQKRRTGEMLSTKGEQEAEEVTQHCSEDRWGSGSSERSRERFISTVLSDTSSNNLSLCAAFITHTTPHTLSDLNSENQDSPVKRTPLQRAIECEHLPTQVGYDDKLESGRDPNEDDEHAGELPSDGYGQVVQKFFGYANRLLQQLSE